MRPLVKQIVADHDQRLAAVANLKVATAKQLTQVTTARQKMAREYRRAADASLNSLRHAVDAFQADCRAAHQGMTAAQRAELSAQFKSLRKEVTAFLREADHAHEAMAVEQRERLVEGADALCRDTADFLEALASEREEMAEAQREALAAGRAALASSVTKTRKALRADVTEARKVWLSVDAAKARGRRSARAASTKSAAAEGAKRDDLTVIRGLGSATQERLNQAGITTFAQLAKATPAKLRELLGDGTARARAEDWIAHARDLAG